MFVSLTASLSSADCDQPRPLQTRGYLSTVTSPVITTPGFLREKPLMDVSDIPLLNKVIGNKDLGHIHTSDITKIKADVS